MDACVMKPINAAELHAALAPLEVIEQNAREQDQISDQQ